MDDQRQVPATDRRTLAWEIETVWASLDAVGRDLNQLTRIANATGQIPAELPATLHAVARRMGSQGQIRPARTLTTAVLPLISALSLLAGLWDTEDVDDLLAMPRAQYPGWRIARVNGDQGDGRGRACGLQLPGETSSNSSRSSSPRGP
ncbi:hypothetical protein ACQPZ8_18150 [Actinomadura nitritigenes]|uniref:hypothetical protein n=1 Tax=Actinomadura nitritigenes TaxID=134602 RepID=UPI003D8A11F9